MTAPTRFCLCGHSKLSHEVEQAPACCYGGCGCVGYRPGAAATRPIGVARPQASPAPASPARSVDQVLAAGQRSGKASTRKLAERIEGHLRNLSDLVRDEHADAERKRREQAAKDAVRREVAELEKQLAAAKAKLTKPRPVAAVEPGVPQACPEPGCDRSFASTQAVVLHRRRAHEGFDPNAAKAVRR